MKRQVLAGFGLALAAVFAMAAMSWRTTAEFVEVSRHAVARAELVAPLERLLSKVYEVEAAQRGFLASGSRAFLGRRQAALADARAALRIVRRSATADEDAPLGARVDRISHLLDTRVAILDQVLAAHAAHPDEARAMLGADAGGATMQALRDQVVALADDQRALLDASAQSARRQSSRVFTLFAAALAGASLLLAATSRTVLRGIAERQRAHEALADSQARLNAVVDTALDAIVVVDGRGVVERFNASAERLFGYPATEALGQDVSMLMAAPARDRRGTALARLRRAGGRPANGGGREVTARRKDGSTFPAELAIGETTVGGQRLFTGLVRDISERKAADARQAGLVRDLRSANEELGNFAHVASHDLKAPLRAIGSLAQWLATDYGDRLDDEGRAQLGLLLARVKRMYGLIDGLLQYARVGRIPVAPAPVALDELVAETIDLLAPPAHVAVTVQPLPPVCMERALAQQLFQNLLANAIQHMDKPRGDIRVECDEEPETWHFRVRDNGPGIARRHWDRVFQLFQTLESRDRRESTGLGLSLVKKIVEMHGGRVWLESEVGHGTAFHFTLPRRPACA